MTSKQKKTWGAVGVALLVAGFLIYSSMESSTLYFWTVDELLAATPEESSQKVRVGGRVLEGSIDYDQMKLVLHFTMQDEKGAGLVRVSYAGILPDTFKPGITAIVEGVYLEGVFNAETLLTKCPSKYEAEVPEEG